MGNLTEFACDLRRKTVRLFMKAYEGEFCDFVEIVNVYEVGNEAFLKVHDVDASVLDFRMIRLSDVDTIEYYANDGVR